MPQGAPSHTCQPEKPAEPLGAEHRRAHTHHTLTKQPCGDGPSTPLCSQLCVQRGACRLVAGIRGGRDTGLSWAVMGRSAQSRRSLPLVLCGPRGGARRRCVPVCGASSVALVTAALLLLPPGLLVPQGDVPGGSGAVSLGPQAPETALHGQGGRTEPQDPGAMPSLARALTARRSATRSR